MPESRRLPLSDDDEAALRDRQIDALLDDGLDRYFAARYEDAIHLWTRVLFLDRSHARARAYIDRARTTLAELQRRSDEMLQASRDLLEQGETDAARQLLTEAVAGSGDDVQAAALRVRLERLERVRALGVQPGEGPLTPEPVAQWSWHRSRWQGVGLGAAAVLAGVLVIVFALGGGDRQDQRLTAAAAAPAATRLPVLSSSEVALVRARTSFARGRLSAALRELDRVGAESTSRLAADQLRIEIQQLLLASARSSSATTPTEQIRR